MPITLRSLSSATRFSGAISVTEHHRMGYWVNLLIGHMPLPIGGHLICTVNGRPAAVPKCEPYPCSRDRRQ